MNLNDDVVYRCLRLGPLHQLHPGRSRSLVRHHYRLHDRFLLGCLRPRRSALEKKLGARTSMRWNSAISAATLNSVPGEIPHAVDVP
jgi:hypothetical protein